MIASLNLAILIETTKPLIVGQSQRIWEYQVSESIFRLTLTRLGTQAKNGKNICSKTNLYSWWVWSSAI